MTRILSTPSRPPGLCPAFYCYGSSLHYLSPVPSCSTTQPSFITAQPSFSTAQPMLSSSLTHCLSPFCFSLHSFPGSKAPPPPPPTSFSLILQFIAFTQTRPIGYLPTPHTAPEDIPPYPPTPHTPPEDIPPYPPTPHTPPEDVPPYPPTLYTPPEYIPPYPLPHTRHQRIYPQGFRPGLDQAGTRI